MESNFEGNFDLKNQFRIKNLPDPISIRYACSKNFFDNKFNDHSLIKNAAHVDFNDKNLNNVCFVKVNSIPTLEEQIKPKIFLDQAEFDGVDNSSLLRLDPGEKLGIEEMLK